MGPGGPGNSGPQPAPRGVGRIQGTGRGASRGNTFFIAIFLDPDPNWIRIQWGLEDLGTVDRSLPPVEWEGSRELAEAPPEVT
jgi:hypothetical protein